jgi:hypothetical protein
LISEELSITGSRAAVGGLEVFVEDGKRKKNEKIGKQGSMFSCGKFPR